VGVLMTNWKLDDNRSLYNLLIYERNITVVVIYDHHVQRANFIHSLQTKFTSALSDSTTFSVKLHNGNLVRLIPLERAQIDTRGCTISLLLFPSSIEYNVRREITRELLVNMIRDGGITGTINI
jgi:hypothetical protein